MRVSNPAISALGTFRGLCGQGLFLSTHLGTKRHVAVKVIMPQYMKEQEFVERFRREAEAAGRLRHPNVVDVTDFGFASFNGQRIAYLVMEYLDGCALDEILEGGEMLPPELALDIIKQTCSAVNDAHRQGIIHRDLKFGQDSFRGRFL
ncbi:MAG: protein kinase [Pyrinomonadaceae bacterium]|nr:protein kinase [Pyrinomonadaceae bacterium]